MRKRLFFAACLASQAVFAQLGVPTVRLPSVPQLPPAQTLIQQLPTATGALDAADLRDLRQLRIRALLAAHGALIERDPHGEPIVRSEILALSPGDAALAAANAAGYTVLRERALEGIDTRIVVLHAPAHVSTARALQDLQAKDPQGSYDFNHIYIESGETAAADPPPTQPGLGSAPAETARKVGLIDGGVGATHPAFRGVTLHEHGCEGTSVPSAHGTAVASLLVGSTERFHGAAPGAELYAADVYCGLPAGGAVDAVADAFAWLAREAVPVINVSLVGPPNLMLQEVVRRVIAHGQIIVAAVGNDGPAAPPLYPASYPDVVGVTAVDRHGRALPEAARGNQVEFAAPGAEMVAAASGRQAFVPVRGTSFAAPIVAGILASSAHEFSKAAADEAIANLAHAATDLGAPGRDPVYGFGLVGEALRPPATLASAR
jgi:subtilisin family serine protease